MSWVQEVVLLQEYIKFVPGTPIMSSEDDESDVATTAFDEKEMLVKEDPIAHDDEEQVPHAYNVIVPPDEKAINDGVVAMPVGLTRK